MDFAVIYFDGVVSTPIRAVARVADTTLVILDIETGAQLGVWELASTKYVRDRSGHDALFSDGNSFARFRLVDTKNDLAPLLAQHPRLAKAKLDRKTKWRVAYWVAGSVSALALIFFALLPAMVDVLTTYMPRETERRIGQKLNGQVLQQSTLFFGADGVCVDEAGLQSVAMLQDALNEHSRIDYKVDITVVDSDLVNAFALPGGQMVLLSGFLEEASSAEEIIAVMAHELGHIDSRHPLNATLAALGRSSILSIVLGDVSGGVVTATVIEALINAEYSRQVEEEADDYAITLLNDMGVGTEPLAAFFDYVANEYGDLEGVWQSFSSHPELTARAAKARAADRHPNGKIKNFDDADYENLLAVCSKVTAIEQGGFVQAISDMRDRLEELDLGGDEDANTRPDD